MFKSAALWAWTHFRWIGINGWWKWRWWWCTLSQPFHWVLPTTFVSYPNPSLFVSRGQRRQCRQRDVLYDDDNEQRRTFIPVGRFGSGRKLEFCWRALILLVKVPETDAKSSGLRVWGLRANVYARECKCGASHHQLSTKLPAYLHSTVKTRYRLQLISYISVINKNYPLLKLFYPFLYVYSCLIPH